MGNIKKYKYSLKTCSSLILSPRESRGFYLADHDFAADQGNPGIDGNTKIIYPFYQYGSYEKYDPENTEYYIPGSSIKGAICAGAEKMNTKLMVDDILIKSLDLKLEKLYKVQYMKPEVEKPISLEAFFLNVKLEMLRADKEYEGELFCGVQPDQYFKKAQDRTMQLLKQLTVKIDSCLNGAKAVKSKVELERISCNINDLIKNNKCQDRGYDTNTYTILLGGYKGRSLSKIIQKDEYQSAIYIDKPRNLPYGLVQITILPDS